jgi:hypothetical protein
MNKKIVAISVLLLMMLAVTTSVFAEDTEYEYTVTVYYSTTAGLKSVTYTFWAASASEAQKVATDRCTREFGPVASCGGAIATGRSKGN